MTFTIHPSVTRVNLYAIQPLQFQIQCKSTYHTKNSRSNLKFQEFSRLTNFRVFFRISRWLGTLKARMQGRVNCGENVAQSQIQLQGPLPVVDVTMGDFTFWNKHLKNVGPIRHCEPPHAHSPGVATVALAIGVQRLEMHQHAKFRHNRW